MCICTICAYAFRPLRTTNVQIVQITKKSQLLSYFKTSSKKKDQKNLINPKRNKPGKSKKIYMTHAYDEEKLYNIHYNTIDCNISL